MTIVSVMKAPEPVDHAALAETIPLDEIDVSNPALYQQDVWQPYFRRTWSFTANGSGWLRS